MNIPTEDEEQKVVVQYLNLLKIDFCAVPNGGHRHKAVAAKLKATGVKPGVPDLLIFTIPPSYPNSKGLAIEMKRRKGGQLRQNQKEWLDRLENIGWMTFVAKGADEAIDLIDILYNKKMLHEEVHGV